ncbi:hypothetical protein SAMN06265182_0662 [Persephonella hydrogeniphila]|uniref:Uncharacterized protein n=1 Tax=Persephonella hydrogeniphila TaxID=198703 RepID=A0A285NEQ8_9AQUI|nr:hypothetical protein [Persephonella hydrogeniphila]SNZ06396.1 hypothetical protein SAMN06265182_0662 [Persephonella hydrogeniphila]
MGVKEIEKNVENISKYYCELLCKTKNSDEKEKLFKTFYESIILIQQIKIDEICREIKDRRILSALR